MDHSEKKNHNDPMKTEESFEQTVHLYRESLIFFLNRYVRNVHTAEDLAEDAFVALLLHPYRGGSASLKTYLFTIGRNKALNYLEKQRRHPGLSLDEVLEKADEEQMEECLLQKERARQVNAVMAQLHEEYRLVLHLLYFEEFSLKEAGYIMRKNRKQMENLSYRARKAMKNALEKGGFRDEE